MSKIPETKEQRHERHQNMLDRHRQLKAERRHGHKMGVAKSTRKMPPHLLI